MASQKKRDDAVGKMRTGPVIRGTGPKTHPPITWTLPKPPSANLPKDKQDNRANVVGKMRTGPVKRGTGPKKFPTKAWDSSKPPGANLPKGESSSESR